MSFTDPQTEDVQPQEGQGDGGTGNPAYAEYLDRISDTEARGVAEEAFKAWDANWTRKSQEHSQYKSQWEPYEQAGVNQLPPDQVAYGLQLVQAMNDPQVMQQWWNEYAQANNLNVQSAEPDVPAMDDFGFQDPQQLQGLIDQAVGPLKQQLEQFQSHIEQQQQQAEQAQLMSKLEGQVAELERKNGKPFSDEEKEVLARFAMRYDDADTAIPRGYEDMQTFRNAIEKQALQAKVDAPNPAEGGGVPDVTPPQFKGLNDPALKAAAMQHLRNDR